MCGIAGLIGGSPAVADGLSAALAHRGPDDSGMFHDAEGGVLLVHRRLAIVDLAPTGHQPMSDASGRFVLCYNGEIYNHLELRRELADCGASFRGGSDSETLIEAFARWGDIAFTRLNGIFALAIWDKRDRVLTLARDGLGVKPLYFTRLPTGLAFASEIKALTGLPGFDAALDRVAVRAYLQYLWSPGERTMFASVRKLDPGTILRIGADGREQRGRFYQLPDYAPAAMSDADAVRGTREALQSAVERQLLADVEVGAFLSGGLDSSAVVHFARQATPGRLRCFTIGYAGNREESAEMVADLPYARLAARHLGVDLHEVQVDARMGDDLERLVTILDEPQADPAALNNLYISAMARRSGLKVLLSGTGGDDIFSGYRRHTMIASGELGDALPRPLLALLAKAGQRIRGDGTIARRLRRASEMIGRDGDERILHALEWLGASEVSRLCSDDLPGAPQSAPLRDALRKTVGSPALERLLRLDQRFFLADHNLNYTDKTGMAESVEIRVPFLDPQLMAFAARLEARQKLRRGRGKWMLRKAMEGLLPNQIIYRPKTGFGVPLRSWLRGGLREMAEELTSETVVGARGLFDPAAVAQLRNDTLSGRRDGAYPLLATMVIELWCRAFADARPASHSPERVVAFV